MNREEKIGISIACNRTAHLENENFCLKIEICGAQILLFPEKYVH